MTLYTMVMVMILYNLDIVDFVHALLNNTVVLCLDDVFVSCMNSLWKIRKGQQMCKHTSFKSENDVLLLHAPHS